LDLAVRDEGDVVAHIELSCADHCRDVVEAVDGVGHIAGFLAEDAETVRHLARTDEISKGAPVPALTWPHIDTTRVAAAGTSYGGYMTNWMEGRTDRFCAIVAHNYSPATNGAPGTRTNFGSSTIRTIKWMVLDINSHWE
jgi:hypothetical protein